MSRDMQTINHMARFNCIYLAIYLWAKNAAYQLEEL